MSLAQTTAAILAGGLGTRLRSVVADRPKVLAAINGRPFIEYLLDQLDAAGVRTVVLCTGHLGEQVEAHLGAGYRRLALRYSRETEPLGTGGALRLALPACDSAHVLILNGDSYCDASFPAFATWHAERHSPASLLLTHAADTRRFGRVETSPDGRIVRFQEKAEASGPGWINAGVYLVELARLAEIPAGRPVSIERDLFPTWIGRGLHGFGSDGTLWDIGVPDAYAQASADFARIFGR